MSYDGLVEIEKQDVYYRFNDEKYRNWRIIIYREWISVIGWIQFVINFNFLYIWY